MSLPDPLIDAKKIITKFNIHQIPKFTKDNLFRYFFIYYEKRITAKFRFHTEFFSKNLTNVNTLIQLPKSTHKNTKNLYIFTGFSKFLPITRGFFKIRTPSHCSGAWYKFTIGNPFFKRVFEKEILVP